MVARRNNSYIPQDHRAAGAGSNEPMEEGVPEEVVERASFILEAAGSDKRIGRLCNENLLAKDQHYKEVVDKLLGFDVSKGDLDLFFRDIFPSTS